MSQFWQNLHARLQPAVPNENTLLPGGSGSAASSRSGRHKARAATEGRHHRVAPRAARSTGRAGPRAAGSRAGTGRTAADRRRGGATSVPGDGPSPTGAPRRPTPATDRSAHGPARRARNHATTERTCAPDSGQAQSAAQKSRAAGRPGPSAPRNPRGRGNCPTPAAGRSARRPRHSRITPSTPGCSAAMVVSLAAASGRAGRAARPRPRATPEPHAESGSKRVSQTPRSGAALYVPGQRALGRQRADAAAQSP